jgi:hypothetical protein
MRWLLILFSLMAWVAHAQPQPFLPVAGFTLESDQNGALYSPTSAAANLHFTQWGNVGEMAPFQDFGGLWMASGTCCDVSVRFHDGRQGPEYDESLTVGGALLPCTTNSGQTREVDLYVEPSPNDLNSAYYATIQDFPSLAQLATLSTQGSFDAVSSEAANAPYCVFNSAHATYQLVLTDKAVTPEQILWYDLGMFHICNRNPNLQPDIPYEVCANATPQVTWFWTGASQPAPHLVVNRSGVTQLVNFGVSDVLQSYGESEMTTFGEANYSWNFLPRLSAFITSGAYGIDANLADWRVASFDYGETAWGNAILSASWQGFLINWTLK